MSEIKVNKITPRVACGTTQLGDSGDTITIPSGATIQNLGTASGFGATGAVNWDVASIKTAGFTAVTGTGYFVDTATTGAVDVTLPLSPAAGDVVGVSDYAKNFNTADCTLLRNGSNIGGIALDADLTTDGVAVTLVYVDATKGWIVTDSGNQSDAPTSLFVAATGGCITTCGDYKMHTFLSPNTFVVTCAGNPSGSTVVDYMVVAGGGGGGGEYGAGAGAGGYRESVPSPAAWTGSPIAFSGNARPVTTTPYAITVGGGGAGASGGCVQGSDGNNSIFSDISSAGGGGGGTECCVGSGYQSGRDGGSGGGAAYNPGPPISVGAGDTPNVTPDQGFPGGMGTVPGSGGHSAGGGGGAGAVGGAAPAHNIAGAGGTGVTSCISTTPTARAGGGGAAGGGGGQAYTPGAGGAGGGGAGAVDSPSGVGTAGTVNTGGGGGGANLVGPSVGGTGGSGIVILRYKYQ